MPYFDGAPAIKHFRSSAAPIAAGPGTSQGSFHVAPLENDGGLFPANIIANTLAIAVSYNWTATSVSQTFASTMKLGLYTRTGSTLNLVNSASATFGASAASTGNSGSFNGVRYITIGTGGWSSTPYFAGGADYFVAVQLLTAVTTTSMSWMNAHTVGTAFSGGMYTAGAPNATNMPFSPFRGVFNATTNAVPSTMQASQITGSGASGSQFPFIRIDDDFKNWIG